MDDIRVGDFWVSAGIDGSQIVYHIKRLFVNLPGRKDCRPHYGYGRKMVEYSITNTVGRTKHKCIYPVSMFLFKPTGSHGRGRKLAVRPMEITDGLR